MAVRIGFLGAGHIATFHSKMLRASGVDVERAGVFDPDRSRSEAFVAAAGGFVADTEDEVLGSCDAVYVCTWTVEHPRQVAAAVAAGVAVFCEKPLGMDLETSQQIVDVLESSGVVHQVGLVLRYSPAFALLESLLEETDLNGRVMTAMFRDDQYLPTGGRYASTWRGDRTKAGRGVLLEHSIHDVDLRPSLRYLEIHCERAWFSVTGDAFGPVRWMRGDEEHEVEGDALLEVCGERSIELDNPDGAFARAVADGLASTPTAATAMRAHRVVEAIYESADAGGAPIDIV